MSVLKMVIPFCVSQMSAGMHVECSGRYFCSQLFLLTEDICDGQVQKGIGNQTCEMCALLMYQ